MLLWLISLYPIKETCESLKKINSKNDSKDEKDNCDITHWCTYWLIYALLLQYDPILSYIPFWGLLSSFTLVMAYSPPYTKMIFEASITSIRYKILLLNKTFNLQKHLDFVANAYIIPGLDFMETNLASKLPSPASDLLMKISEIVHSVLICQNSSILREKERNRDGPYKTSDPMLKTD